jgi:large subunit ribosomal protein L19e
MKLGAQKRLAGQILRRSPRKIKIDPRRLEEVKESITKADIRSLIIDGAITGMPVRGNSKGRIRRNLIQKSKGRRSGAGTRKGRLHARSARKTSWVHRIRKLREFLRRMKSKGRISGPEFRELYQKSKGGFFRSEEHLKLFMTERGFFNKK